MQKMPSTRPTCGAMTTTDARGSSAPRTSSSPGPARGAARAQRAHSAGTGSDAARTDAEAEQHDAADRAAKEEKNGATRAGELV